MALPGFLPAQTPNATAQLRISAPTSRHAAQDPATEITPAGCAWYDYIYAPVACGFVASNEANGIHGYGLSPCTCWQIPLDPIGCAALPSSRNRLGSISWCE
ncbi:hypothetical protein ABT040_16205 [Streptomyces sp. NPDC002688]|uniref:hypothetical protein n=1 Tax=Streptomyces sp. NPDC002688 TaxID=3154423 RepID=UPI003316BD9F